MCTVHVYNCAWNISSSKDIKFISMQLLLIIVQWRFVKCKLMCYKLETYMKFGAWLHKHRLA